ncbi:hypothetical protein HAX54_005090 [Datura stramonium]|uniref:J domain-containing protein n=1 Tax=Datura stramonium TaxID=4076 RepID=A0ABS8T9C1_DATST|nr:hypothetical protein [Datura stramonium]
MNLLNPNQNRDPFANEAFNHVLRAWSTLSNPTQKARFDDELKGKGKEGSFRTVCSYCYYVYVFFKDGNGRKEESLGVGEKFVETNDREMNKRVTKMMKGLQKRLGKLWPTLQRSQDQQLIGTNSTNATNLLNPNQNRYPFANEAFKHVYGDCCLKYQNKNCKRAFHTLPIVGPPPLPEVAEKGENYCLGFSVLGTEGKSPFVRKNEDNFDGDEVIEISDDEIEDGNGRKKESLGVE